MAIMKKNIWSIFYIIFFIGVIVLSSVLYSVYINTYDEYKQEQENITKMTANSISSVFLQYEMLLNIIGKQLIQHDTYKSLEHSQEILDDLVDLNPSILGLTLVKPNGNVYITSSNLNTQKTPNLLEKKETLETFKYTLTSEKMVIGRTYFIKQINSFIIPIRKTIKDKNNKVIAVMTAGIDLNKGFDFFIKNKQSDFVHETFLFRDFDYYFQIAQKVNFLNTKIYDYPIPKDLVQKALVKVSKKYSMSIDEIKNGQIVVSIESEDRRQVLSSSIYLKRYELWLTTQFPLKILYNNVLIKAIVLILIFMFVNIIIFFLFKYINNYEKRKQKSLYHQATHDYLTNLYNRLYLSLEFNKLHRNKPFTVLFIDMDNFKNINDSYGHNYGDKILIEISHRLTNLKKNTDLLVRYSGDEFIFLTQIMEKDDIEKLSNSILKKLSEPYFIEQYQLILGASIGISQFPFDGKDFEEVKRYADIAMYEAKKTRNTYCIFDSSLKDAFLQTSIIEQELKSALSKDEIYMMYQPQFNANGILYGVEALVRWENRKLGFIPPDKFISIAESIGFMDKLGKFIIKKSLLEIKSLQIKSNINFQLSINISVKQFMEANFYKNLLSYIEEFKFDKSLITLEVTENVFIEDIGFILKLLSKVKKVGIKISLDDFGTGYSSLALLKKLPIDELKIDKSFVDDITNDDNSKAMAENIISIGKKLNMIILAEGVETIEQKKVLTEYGCDLFQGYYFSKPLKIDKLLSYITNK